MKDTVLLESSLEEKAISGAGFDIEELVSSATWKDLLLRLVETNKLDPWDIDIGKIAVDYISTIAKMKLMDLSVPANILFAASYLLKLKSEYMQIFPESGSEEAETDEGQHQRVLPDIPNLVVRSRHLPYRKITLQDLMDALDDAIKIGERREVTTKSIVPSIEININKDDIYQKMDAAYRIFERGSDADGSILFSKVSRGMDTESMIFDLFVPMLFLEQNGKVILFQDPFFSEIIIKLGKRGG